MSKEFQADEVAKHNSKDSLWLIVDGGVYDVTEFQEEHPGGARILTKNAGKDCSEAFWSYHSEKILKNVAAEYKIGEGECCGRLLWLGFL